MIHTKKEQDEFVDNMIEFIKGVPDEDRTSFTSELLFNAALFGGYNYYETIGLLHETIRDHEKAMDDFVCEECQKKEQDVMMGLTKPTIKGN